jgi:signal transduction histidine kinase
MVQDLQDERRKILYLQRIGAWQDVARKLAHEIKNPLTPMRMSAQLMLRAHRDGDTRWIELAERLAKNVLEQTDALDRIASDFRQFAGSPARTVVELDADEMLRGIEELVASMSEASQIDIDFAPGAPGTRVLVDVQEIRRVFLNLIHNAIQACGADGRIQVSSQVADRRVEIRVEDNGAGVPEDARAHLFEPYFTTKTSGTGLGLAICRKIVEAHDGEIKLESSVPRRTVFLLSLPARAPDGAALG